MCRSPFIYWLFLFFCGSFGEGDTPLRGAGWLSSVRGGVLLRASSARRGVASCFVGAAGRCFVGAAVAVAGGGMKKPLSVSERRAVF